MNQEKIVFIDNINQIKTIKLQINE